MTDKRKNILSVSLVAAVLFSLALWCWVKPADPVSLSERRALAALPELSAETVWSGKFMEGFEKYAADQFPLRDGFRALKVFCADRLLGQKDVNGIYGNGEGYLSKLEYPLNEDSLRSAAGKFRKIQERYLRGDGVRVYLSVVPDKNYFMAGECGALAMDYVRLVDCLRENTEGMEYIDIFPCLSLEDYYKTDTHWRQEKILPVAEKLAEAMGAPLPGSYETVTLPTPFYGVYAGQSARRVSPEPLSYLLNDTLEGCTVYDYESGEEMGVYDMDKAAGADAYELFLSGSRALMKIQNPAAETERRLILFRDSFGSSLAPLLASGYAEIDVVDIRYISSALLENFLTFENCDVLFLYSTLVLNHSVTLK